MAGRAWCSWWTKAFRSGIAAINFTGNNSHQRLAAEVVIATKETGWLSWLLRDDNYTQEELERDRELIRQYYANHGFPDAQVTSAVGRVQRRAAGLLHQLHRHRRRSDRVR